jgi:hypothetical protein
MDFEESYIPLGIDPKLLIGTVSQGWVEAWVIRVQSHVDSASDPKSQQLQDKINPWIST